MAAKKKTENIKKKKVDFLQSIKDLTKWINNPRRTEDQLIDIVERNKLKNNIARRILSYNFGFPYIIKYFNDYFNGLYDFEKYDTSLLIKSLVYLMDVNNRSNSRLFMYVKSNDLKDEVKGTIKSLIKDYFQTVHNIDCNRRDLDVFYRLFKIGVIKDEDLLEIDRLLNGDKPLIKSLNFINYSDAIKVQDPDESQYDELLETGGRVFSEEIVKFIDEIKEAKQTCDTCKKCALFSKPIVVLDTNSKTVSDVDVVFVGLNPGKDEVEKGLPFVGDSGRYIRNLISQLPKETTWTIFNIILCSTPNKNEITAQGSVNDIISNCLVHTTKILQSFPAKLYIPIGDDAKAVFGIDEKISAISGKLKQLDNGMMAIPLIHPSSVLRNGKNKAIFDKSVQNIIDYIDPDKKSKTRVTNDIAVNKDKVVESEKGLLLVDIKRLEANKVLMIFTDLAGEKKYIIKDYSFPVLIKNKKWDECDMITDKINDVCNLTDWEKSNISKKCHQLLKDTVDV